MVTDPSMENLNLLRLQVLELVQVQVQALVLELVQALVLELVQGQPRPQLLALELLLQ